MTRHFNRASFHLSSLFIGNFRLSRRPRGEIDSHCLERSRAASANASTDFSSRQPHLAPRRSFHENRARNARNGRMKRAESTGKRCRDTWHFVLLVMADLEHENSPSRTTRPQTLMCLLSDVKESAKCWKNSAFYNINKGTYRSTESAILMKFGMNVVFKNIFDTCIFFFFISNSWCWRGENYPQSWGCETYFVKYLGNYWKYRFCVNWWNYCFLTTKLTVYFVKKKPFV